MTALVACSYNALMADPASHSHRPSGELLTRSKLSCLAWSAGEASQLISSDYEGVVTLWDASSGNPVNEYEAHERRIWSIDFCTASPELFASGSDDGCVKVGPVGACCAAPAKLCVSHRGHDVQCKLGTRQRAGTGGLLQRNPSRAGGFGLRADMGWQVWSTQLQNHVALIPMKANVCCVNFSPTSAHALAVGSADHGVHIYDLRALQQPVHTFSGKHFFVHAVIKHVLWCSWPTGD